MGSSMIIKFHLLFNLFHDAVSIFFFRDEDPIRDPVILWDGEEADGPAEEEFVSVCTGCGQCLKVCPNNALQSTFLEAGLAGLYTPRLVPRVGYCEEFCNFCGMDAYMVPCVNALMRQSASVSNRQACTLRI
jgi:ferredoxin